MLRSHDVVLVTSRGEAGEEDDEGSEEEQDHGSKLEPDTDAELGVAAAVIFAVAVDVVLDDASPDEIRRQHHDREHPGQARDERGQQGTAQAGAEREEEGDEREPAHDRVQDHDARERLAGVGGGMAEGGLVDGADDGCGIVTDVFGGAVILVRPIFWRY